MLLAAVLAAPSASAQTAWQARAAVTVDARGELGTGRLAGLDLGAVGVGPDYSREGAYGGPAR